ncbi:MAG: DNA-3-methyladenine glycosylase 2 [Longimicrobiales bacterium]
MTADDTALSEGMLDNGIAPTRQRNAAGGTGSPADVSETLTLQLAYRPPFDWSGMMAFLGMRAMRGVERVCEDAYLRTVELGEHRGWIHVRHDMKKRVLLVEFTHSLAPVLPALLGRLRDLFDLSARPDVIAAHLSRDERLAAGVARNPGLRVPGAFDGFELALRAILGQQITVKAAATLAGRLVEAFGEPIATPHPGLTRLCPTAERVAAADVEVIGSLGIVRARSQCMVGLAGEVAAGRLRLEAGGDAEATVDKLIGLPGIGPWTAQYIAMRALRWPDAFPKEDVALRNRLGGVSPSVAEKLSQPWRPWRSYATLHLWHSPPRPAVRS